MQKYISSRKVQQYLSNYYEKTKKTASLYDAVFSLYKQNNIHNVTNDKRHPSQDLQSQLIDSLLDLNLDMVAIINRFPQLSEIISESKQDIQIIQRFQHEQSTSYQCDTFEINIILKGAMKLNCQNETQIINENSLVIISPLTPHKIEVINDSIVICLTIKKTKLRNNFQNLLRSENEFSDFFNYNLYSPHDSFLLRHIEIDDLILETLQHIVDEVRSNSKYSNEICYNHISNLFSYILRNLSSASKTTNRRKSFSHKIVLIINWIKSHAGSVNLDLLSRKFGYEKAYLGKLIKQSTGYSFNYLRNYHRIRNSCYLLKYTDKTVETISIEVGYNSPNHFTRCFCQLRNTSPIKYRRAHLIK